MHSYLDDGPAMQFSHYGGYLGWAALELYVVETLIGARLAHCYGGLVPVPTHRAVVGLALDNLRDGDSLGSMIYGDTVSYARDRERNLAVLEASVMVDIATQLHRPTGHAINPVPLSEAERIPDADEILEVHRIARELEREVRQGAPVLDWAWVERRAAEATEYAQAFRDAVLAHLEDDGTDVTDPAQLLLALRRSAPVELEQRVPRLTGAPSARDLEARRRRPGRRARPPHAPAARRPPRRARRPRGPRRRPRRTRPRASARRRAGDRPAELDHPRPARAQAAADEDADAIVLATYNGGALTLGRELTDALETDARR